MTAPEAAQLLLRTAIYAARNAYPESDWSEHLNALRDLVAAAAKADTLAPYVKYVHAEGCHANGFIVVQGSLCDCGLEAALAEVSP